MDIEYAVGIIRRDDIDPMAIDQLQTIRLATSFSIPIMDISFHDTQKTIDAIKIVKRFGGMSIVVDSLSRLSRDWQSLQSIFKYDNND